MALRGSDADRLTDSQFHSCQQYSELWKDKIGNSRLYLHSMWALELIQLAWRVCRRSNFLDRLWLGLSLTCRNYIFCFESHSHKFHRLFGWRCHPVEADEILQGKVACNHHRHPSSNTNQIQESEHFYPEDTDDTSRSIERGYHHYHGNWWRLISSNYQEHWRYCRGQKWCCLLWKEFDDKRQFC